MKKPIEVGTIKNNPNIWGGLSFVLSCKECGDKNTVPYSNKKYHPIPCKRCGHILQEPEDFRILSTSNSETTTEKVFEEFRQKLLKNSKSTLLTPNKKIRIFPTYLTQIESIIAKETEYDKHYRKFAENNFVADFIKGPMLLASYILSNPPKNQSEFYAKIKKELNYSRAAIETCIELLSKYTNIPKSDYKSMEYSIDKLKANEPKLFTLNQEHFAIVKTTDGKFDLYIKEES